MRAWILERRLQLLAADDVDEATLRRTLAELLPSSVVVLVDELELTPAEISLVPSDGSVSAAPAKAGRASGDTSRRKSAASTAPQADRGSASPPGASAPTKSEPSPPPPASSRAVIVKTDSILAHCPGCDEEVRGSAKIVLCNVYEKNVWRRIERWHIDCYTAAGSPHGRAEVQERKFVPGSSPFKRKAEQAALKVAKRGEQPKSGVHVCRCGKDCHTKAGLVTHQKHCEEAKSA